MQNGAVAMNSVQELSKSLVRKFKKIKFQHVKNIDGFETSEKEYKKIREAMIGIETILTTLGNYEYGNKFFKNIKDGLEYLNKKASMDFYKNNDVFEDTANVGKMIKNAESNPRFRNIGENYEKCFSSISKSKRKLNIKFDEIQSNIKELKHEAKIIDFERKKLFNLRYDLELNIVDNNCSEELKSNQLKEFKKQSKLVSSKMNKFSEGNEIVEIFKKIAKEYKNHMEDVVDLLRDLN